MAAPPTVAPNPSGGQEDTSVKYMHTCSIYYNIHLILAFARCPAHTGQQWSDFDHLSAFMITYQSLKYMQVSLLTSLLLTTTQSPFSDQ